MSSYVARAFASVESRQRARVRCVVRRVRRVSPMVLPFVTRVRGFLFWGPCFGMSLLSYDSM